MSDFAFYVLLPITIRVYALRMVDWTIHSLLIMAPLCTVVVIAIVMATGRLTRGRKQS